jgi:hypothetical protein
MKLISALLFLSLFVGGCGSEDEVTNEKPVEKIRETVKDAVSREFKTLEGAKDSLNASQEKTKAALEALEKESK